MFDYFKKSKEKNLNSLSREGRRIDNRENTVGIDKLKSVKNEGKNEMNKNERIWFQFLVYKTEEE